MIRSWTGAATGLGLLALTIFCLWNRDSTPVWTSRSPEALEALEAGLDDIARYYWTDAEAQFERALELDPDMPIAKLQLALLYRSDDSQRRELWKELEATSTEVLSNREQFLIEYWLARHRNQAEQAEAVLTEYMADRAKSDGDPYGLAVLCDDRWEAQNWTEAESCYRRLISLHPNWVQAQSRLGLIAMAMGHFDQADESFQTFRYIAPDQAAPYDSIGQLQTVLGQYEAAEESFEKALGVKSDYCMAVQHLHRLYFTWGKLDLAVEAASRMADLEGCGYLQKWGLLCASRAWNRYASGDRLGAQQVMEQGCLENRGGFDLLAYRLAVLSGDTATVAAMEEAIEAHIGEKNDAGFQGRRSYLESLLFHARGVRSFAEQDWSTACSLFKKSDDLGLYWGLERASFKLYNRQHLLRCYEKAGHPTAAMAMRSKIQAINPRYLEIDRMADFEEAR